jgi:citrate lyase subunit beta/citryl-CoA lyase
MTKPVGLWWRSLLFVPVTATRFVEKAHTRGADAIQLDLEDSIALSEKEKARRMFPDAVEQVSRGGADVVVRINHPVGLALRDLEVVVRPGVQAIALPKVPNAEHVQMLDEFVSDLEQKANLPKGNIRFITMVETAEGFLHMPAIANACPRVAALSLGSEDFATSIGIFPESDLLFGPKQMTVIAARAAGVLPLGLVGTVAIYQDEQAFREVARTSRRLGFVGASAIHPKQVPILNDEFSPRTSEVDYARRLLAAFDAALEQGQGAIEFEGKMVDEPIAVRARATLKLHELISYRQHGHMATGTVADQGD